MIGSMCGQRRFVPVPLAVSPFAETNERARHAAFAEWATGPPLHQVANMSPGLGGRVLTRRDSPLDPGYVVPRTVLPADAPVGSDGLEPHGAVQADARVVRHCHARDSSAEAALSQTIEQRVIESATAAGPARGTR
jgi:hypothetical protein